MTEKQKEFLKRYITEDRIAKLNNMNFNLATGFINLIMNTANSYHNFCLVDIKKEIKCTELESNAIEKIINDNRKYYTKTTDEYCSVIKAYVIPKYDKTIYEIYQYWHKGSFDERMENSFLVFEDGEKYRGIYNILFDMGIYFLSDFMKYLRDNSFEEM